MRLKEIAGGQTYPFFLFFTQIGWTNVFIYLFLDSAQRETCIIKERRLREHSCESEEKQPTAAQMKWRFTALSVLWMFNGKNQESLVNSYSCVLLMLV